MYISVVTVITFASYALAQSLFEVLASHPNLSSLGPLLTNSAIINASALSSATNITFLAPDNDAIGLFANSSAGAALDSDPQLVQAILRFSMALFILIIQI